MEQNILENDLKEKIKIESKIAQAAKAIPPIWPLKTAIACNPLLHLEDRNFWKAIEIAENSYRPVSEERIRTEFVNRQMIKWSQAYFDEGVAMIRIPSSGEGFYKTWKELALFDDQLIESKEEKRLLSLLPDSAAAAIEFVLGYLEIVGQVADEFLARQISQLPGWAGYIRWKAEWDRSIASTTSSLTEFLAVRLGIYLIASTKKRLNQDRSHNNTTEKKRFKREEIEHKENEFAEAFVKQIVQGAQQSSKKKTPSAQWVFCIDIRSEPLRRELEKVGNYETFGFAGFFGLPIEISEADKEIYASCPVLLKPKWKLGRRKKQSGFFKYALHELKNLGNHIYQELKFHFGTPFALAETLGAYAGLWMGFKCLASNFIGRLDHNLSYGPPIIADPIESIPIKDQVDLAESALHIMGLTDFAPLVVFCGHRSKSQNNPFASSLDCGACGGNHGGANAHLLATILNSRAVRKELNERGLCIPEDTLFIGAEHNTTTDEIIFFEENPAESLSLKTQGCQTSPTDFKNKRIFELRKDAEKATKANREKRYRLFQGQQKASDKGILRKSLDWSEVRPEWGLSGNAAFLIGTRSLSECSDLKGRSFLHSYDWQQDPEGVYLETILTAPMVVAQWINAQYFFSTIDQRLYGSGSKTTQNVVGKVGVMQGNGSDLMYGLPLHSVFISDQEPFHEPLRLLTVVFSPKSRIDQIILRQPVLQKLFYNEWVHLVAIDPVSFSAFRLNSNGEWNLLK